MINKYIAPKLTKYGKIEDIIQAGSGDLTGDGIDDTIVDNNGDGKADVVVGGANGGTTNVTFIANVVSSAVPAGNNNVGVSADFYDSNGDGIPDFAIADLNDTPKLQRIQSYGGDVNYITLSNFGFFPSPNIGVNTNVSNDDGWNDPARD